MIRITKSLKERVDQADEGFTLIELMVVVLILGILMAIAIPTFLGAKNGANARAAQSNLTNAITAQQSYFSTNQAYATGALLVSSNAEPAITFTDGTTAPTNNGNAVEVMTAAPTTAVQMGALGKDGNCYYVYDSNGQVAYWTDSKCSLASGPATAPTYPVSGNSAGHWGANW